MNFPGTMIGDDPANGVRPPCRFPRFNRSAVAGNAGTKVASARIAVERGGERLLELSSPPTPSDTGSHELRDVLRAAWAVLLRTYTGQDVVTFDFYEGRSDGDDPCCCAASTVFELHDAMTTSKMLGSAKTEGAGESATEESFDTGVVVWRNASTREGKPPTTSVPTLHRRNRSLRLLVKISNDTVILFLEWSTTLLGMTPAQGRLVASTFGEILSSLLVAHPNTQLKDLGVLSRVNVDQVHSWNEAISTEAVERCIHHIIGDRFADRPDVDAVCAWDGSFSYRELDEISGRLAAQLMQRGVGPEILVPLCFEKTKWTIVAMLAVLRAGAAFVPLDPSHPAERLRGLCESIGASLILSSRKHAATVSPVAQAVVTVDDGLLTNAATAAADSTAVSPANAAYVIFTSGSTGKPKGTLIEHRAFCSSARAHAPALRIDSTCRVLQFAAHTFDASLVEILTPLMVGACVCIPDEQERLDDLAGAINRLHVNHAVLTPSFVGFLSPDAVPGLKKLVLAGEAMSERDVQTWSERVKLVNGYGPAESSVAAVCNTSVKIGTDPKEIGFPCGVRVWVVDPMNHHRLVPIGCVGEMLLEGPSLSRGYINDRAKTEGNFVLDPEWAHGSERRFYKTGDLARYSSAGGSLTYVGRKDTQVKLHGQRIELGEIEHHLATDERVEHVAVMMPRDGPTKGRVVSVLSLKATATSSQHALKLVEASKSESQAMDAIRSRLEGRLPAYMVPSVWLHVETIPMLPSQKMDRKIITTWVENVLTQDEYQRVVVGVAKLLAPDASSGDHTTLTPIEAKLCAIWSLVLGLPVAHIAIEDRSFVSLGGDSITAMTCVSHAKKAQLGLAVRDVLRAKTLSQLANIAQPLESNEPGDDASEETTEEPFELSPIQQLHFQTRGEAEGDEHFNQSFCLRVARPVDPEVLRGAIEVMVQRHGMLRARFERGEDGVWRQVITRDVTASYRFRFHVLSPGDDGAMRAAISSAQGCMKIRRGPVFAAELLDVAGAGQTLFLTAHHLVVDLVSWRNILEELEELIDNHTAATPRPSLPFQQWIALQRNDCSSEDIATVVPAAMTQLNSGAMFPFWGMHSHPNLYGDVTCATFQICPSVTHTLLSDKCLAPIRAEAVDLLLAALLYSFGQVFQERPLPSVFNEGHGREPPSNTIDISRTVGWFTTLFPICLQQAAPNFVSTLIQTKDQRRRAPSNGREYFASRFHNPAAKEWATKHENMEIAFNFLGRYQQLEREGALFLPGESMAGESHQGGPTADFGHAAKRFALFEISAVIIRGGIRFNFAWNTKMDHQERISKWVRECEQTLIQAASSLPILEPRLTAGDFDLISGLTTSDVDAFERGKLPGLTKGLGWGAVEDIYPTSGMQQGLLMSRGKDDSFYAVRRWVRVEKREEGGEVNVERLVDAWRGVVSHHALLRTVFVEALSQAGAGGFDQVVLREVEAPVEVHCSRGGKGDVDVDELAKMMEPMEYRLDRPQHRFAVFQDKNEPRSLVCALEMSHAIMDGSSMDILLRDLGRSYQLGSLESVRRPLFKPFIESLSQRDPKKDIGFWADYLKDAEPCHFPVLNDGVVSTTKELRSLRVEVPHLQELQAFCTAKGLTLLNAVATAWALVLRAYVGADISDVCFGYLVSGRDAAAVEGSGDAVGPFISMATLRARFHTVGAYEQELTLLQLAEAVQQDLLSCMPYAQTSLAEVQHALKLPGGIPLFNTCLSFRRRFAENTINRALDFEDAAAIQDPTEYPISLNIETTSDMITAFIDLDYWTDAISSPQADHIGTAFAQALASLVEHPDVAASQADFASQSSKDKVWSWNANMPVTTVDCLHRRVEEQVALQPQAQAIRGWDADFSYQEMNSLSDQLAHYLVNLGVCAEVLVPVCFDKSAWTVIAMLGVLKAGGGVVPLDASHPIGSLEGKVEDTGASVVVASESRAGVFESMVPYVVAVGPMFFVSDLAGGKLEGKLEDTPPDSPSFVMFTSGSTGKPKGVVLSHQALVSSCLAHGAALGLSPETRFLQFAAHTFDNSIEEMFTTLIHGGCVCVPSEEDRMSDLPGAITALNANIMDLTPTVAALLRPHQVPGIKTICVGGEALTQEVLEAWAGTVALHNQYGPSECSINSTHRLHTNPYGDVSNLGRSVGSISWIVSSHNHNILLPIGCVGELLIEGPILAQGYLNRPDLTAKAFVECPEWAKDDPRHWERGVRRMYKTGDLVRYTSAGELVYLGRKDGQVKLHGQRIELGEVEYHVKGALEEGVKSAVELMKVGEKKALAAFIVLPGNEEGENVTILPPTPEFMAIARETAAAVSGRVASYMVPSLFFPVSKMPRTSSGKLDRRRLRDSVQEIDSQTVMSYRPSSRSTAGRTPETGMEKTLQQLWADVLKVDVESIGADDNFFRHGGDSIGAMRLANAARQKGLVLTVASVFQAPKLSEMVRQLKGSEGTGPGEMEVYAISDPVEPFSLLNGLEGLLTLQSVKEQASSLCRVDIKAIEDLYPCTPLQAGLIAASQKQPGAYVAINTYELPVNTDVAFFKAAWEDIVKNEAVLRTRIVFIEGIGFTQVLLNASTSLEHSINWASATSTADTPTAYGHLPPHDGGALSRYIIIQPPTGPPTFTWIAHHALYDGWSLSTLLSRVSSRYYQPTVALYPTPHYSRFVEYMNSLEPTASDAFWSAALSDAESTAKHLPPLLPHPGYRVQVTGHAQHTAHIPKPKNAEFTNATLLRAAWALILSAYSSSDDVVFCEVLNGRDVPVSKVEDLVGPTLASIPRRVRFDRATPVSDVLKILQGQFSEVIPHQFVGLQRIKSLGPAAATACQFGNLFAIDTADNLDTDSKQSLWGRLVSGGNGQSADFFNYPLNVTCSVGQGSSGEIEVTVRAHFDPEVLEPWQVKRMLGQFEAVLHQLVSENSKGERIGGIQFVSPEDKVAVREWNSVPGPTVERCVHELISEKLASQEEGSLAVVGWDAELSNRQLEVLSSSLAGVIRREMVGREGGSRFIPFCFEKSTSAIVAMIAILKAGAAFVPLDPVHPMERLKDIVGNCEGEIILCSPKYGGLCRDLAPTVMEVSVEGLMGLTHVEAQMQSWEGTARPSDPAYIIWTSGTTGRPKGTIISHASFTSSALAHGPLLGMQPPFRFLQFASYTFDASILEILTTLIMGGTVCVPRNEDRTNGSITEFMERTGVTMTLLTPSFSRTLKPADVPTLKTLILGGEAMSQRDLDTWVDNVNLINAYGPSETSIIATVNPKVSHSSSPANIGRAIGRSWIVDPRNHNQLAPLGSVGELLVEGPTLSDGYLQNDTKTKEMFIDDPEWAKDDKLRYYDHFDNPRRFYKTGDLVRICNDISGEMIYVGRKDDSQVKVNGQRLELDEIVHHLVAETSIQHAAVVFPKEGPFAKRLVSVMALAGTSGRSDGGDMKVISVDGNTAALVEDIKERLRSKVPTYMVPPHWVVVDHIPLLPSGKLNRGAVGRLVEGMGEEVFRQITTEPAVEKRREVIEDDTVPQHTTKMEEGQNAIEGQLRNIWAQILNIPPSAITPSASFLHLGGDSINAMQVMARLRTLGIQATVQNIINSKSVSDLALKVGRAASQNTIATSPDEDKYEFDPSPIQQLYFEIMGDKVSNGTTGKQFNQSVMLRLRRQANPSEFARGLHALVEAHSMLSARFRQDGKGNWRQRITADIAGSYRLKMHSIRSLGRMKKRVEGSQAVLDVQRGPLLAADCFTVSGEATGGEHYVFLTIHHLVVDVVSWGVLLQDLEDFFVKGVIARPASMPFQIWTRAQAQRAQDEENGATLLPHDGGSDVDLEYWGIKGGGNVHGDVVSREVKLNLEATALLLGKECHQPLETEPLDLLLACLLVSYRNAMPGRSWTPTIYNETHGREPWDRGLDLSRTVGWFTGMYPVHLPIEARTDQDFIKAVRWVKDFRRRIPGKGRPYFAHRLLTSQGRKRYGSQWPVEVMFNYLGQMQGLTRTDTYLEHVRDATYSASDIGNDVTRFALLEVSARVVDSKMHLSFSYNKHLRHQEQIAQWVENCPRVLGRCVQLLTQVKRQTSLSNFPLLPLSYHGVENLDLRLGELGIKLGEVEDVYPCSPMQSGLLLGQMRSPDKYAYSAVFHISSMREDVDVARLCRAWQSVVKRHSTLRTVFIDTVGDDSLMDQVVLRDVRGEVSVASASGFDEALASIKVLENSKYDNAKPSHRLLLYSIPNNDILLRLDISHAIADGSSMPIILNDLITAYDNTKNPPPAPLYRDYIAHFQSQPRSSSIKYWKTYLSGAEPCLFPTLVDGKTNLTHSLGSHILPIKGFAKISQCCVEAGVTLSTLFQLVWGLVLRTYTGMEDVMFGYLASGRDIPVANIENGVGAFINMLVCRLKLPLETELGDIFDALRVDFTGAMDHQTCSLAEIQHELQMPGTGLFNTAFTYQKRRGSVEKRGTQLPTLQYKVLDAEDPSEYAVTLNVEATDTAVEVHFSHWQDIVSKAMMGNIAAAFEQILQDIVLDSRDDRTVGEVRNLGNRGLEELARWNNFSLPKVERCVHEIVEEHARLMPDKQAVCGWDFSFTYRELNEAADALARHLVQIGVRGGFVPLCFDKSAWTVVAQLAALKAGCAFVNFDPAHPEERLRGLLEDLNTLIILTTAAYRPKMERLAKTVVLVDKEVITTMLASPPQPKVSSYDPSTPAYIIFTSGTTGKPKGTIIEHAAFCTGAFAHAEAMFMRPGSRVLQFASYTFDASIMETLSCLLIGGTVCVPSDLDRMNDLAATIRSMNVTWALLTPSVASTLKPESLPCLKVLVTGGEAMTPGHIDRWGTWCALVNAYGPTECSVVATTSVKVDEGGRVCDEDPATIGTATGGRVWVVDSQCADMLVPVGGVGELLVEGAHVARGYLNMSEQTERVFIQSPKWTRHPELTGLFQRKHRMYLTGDLVRYNSDGSVSYISRKDTQIKVNGRRIELGEIEFHCKAGLPDGTQVAVNVVTGKSNGHSTSKSIAVFFSLADGRGIGKFTLLQMDSRLRGVAQQIATHASGHLPVYMVPVLFIPVSTIPWTTAGKLDRRLLHQSTEGLGKAELISYKLPKTATSASTKDTQPRAEPRSEMEKTLEQLWQLALGLGPGTVSVKDSFFHLGGDSLTAMKLVGAASAHMVRLSVLDVFEHPVLGDMAKACREMSGLVRKLPPTAFELLDGVQEGEDIIVGEAAIQCELEPTVISDLYPCSPLQEALFTLANKQVGAYVAINTLELSRNIDLDRFKAAWQTVVDGTDILRTRIVHLPSAGFLQAVIKSTPIAWHQYRRTEDAVSEGQALGSQNGGELTRYGVVYDSKKQPTHFIWAIHHALYDGWSLPRVARRVQQIYDAAIKDTPPPSYSSFIRYLKSRDSSVSVQFWTDTLKEASAITNFPQLPSSRSTQGPKYSSLVSRMKIDRSSLLGDITMSTVVRASWAVLTSAYTGMDSVIFGETLSGRNINVVGVEDIAGPTFTTVPSRLQLNRRSGIADFLLGVQRAATNTVPHQHFGLQHIKQLNGDCSTACDFQNLLIIQPEDAQGSADAEEWNFQGGSSTDTFFTHPLVVEAGITANSISFTLHHDENVISPWQAERLACQLQEVVRQLVRGSKQESMKLGDIHAFSPKDSALVQGWNNKQPVTVESCIHELFIERTLQHPERVGIDSWDCQLTYGEALDFASRLAFHLAQMGVKPGTMVPVCVTRSAWSIVTLLGVLMAGCAFVPFDPAHPPSRQTHMLQSVSATIMLCSPESSARFLNLVEKCIVVGESWLRQLKRPITPPTHTASPGDTAYVLFTSGSTGLPKGVVVSHHSFCSSSQGFALATNLTQSTRAFHFASLTFDVSLMETLTPLTLGGVVCVPTEEERLHSLGSAISRFGATWAFLTPSVANLVDPETVRGSLKTLVCGGEAMTEETVKRWGGREGVELMNGYGPTEASVLAVVNPSVSTQMDKGVIGFSHRAACAWVVEPRGEAGDWLSPVGAVGELVISGPLLAQGYLNDREKTAKAFVEGPRWAKTLENGPARIYRTGDLVRYQHDGAFEFIGRRDGQVKVNGQRIELGEIESRLSADGRVQLALVTQPKSGPCQNKLVAVLTLARGYPSQGVKGASVSVASAGCKPATGPPHWQTQTRKDLEEVRGYLADVLPSYMVPAVWIVLESMPVIVSGKLDRQQVGKWVDGLDEKTAEEINRAFGIGNEADEEEEEMTATMTILRKCCAEELRVSEGKVKMGKSFLSLGGDSIRAMGLISRARKAGVNISVQDVLRSRTLRHLAQLAKEAPGATLDTATETNSDEPFALSPIQGLYMDLAGGQNSGHARFNQSFSMSVYARFTTDAIKDAVTAVVHRHGMLRALFIRDNNGSWLQQTSESESPIFVHHLKSPAEARAIAKQAQQSLSVESGPVFRADILTSAEQDNTNIFMTAHHLCVDVVSWRIISSDLMEMLETGSLSGGPPMSFRSWCSLQAKHIQSLDSLKSLPFEEKPCDLAYWGVDSAPVYDNADTESFSLDASMTRLAMADCHHAFDTKPVDIFLAAIAQSFSRAFHDREVATIYNESHGREPLRGCEADLSRTVGWFTSICPLAVPVDDENIINTVRRTKDVRRGIPDGGVQYFAKKWLEDNRAPVALMEILFNFLGEGMGDDPDYNTIQGLDSEDTSITSAVSDVGPQARRLALFEISAIVIQGQLRFTFIFDRTIEKLTLVRNWVARCQATLKEMVQTLSQHRPEPTLSDYPLLSLTYDGLDQVTKVALPRAGITNASKEIEDIYPCTPVQEGILISQLRDPKAYFYHAIYEVRSTTTLDSSRLARAWVEVVNRHAALRTLFIDTSRRGSLFDQAVLREANPLVPILHCNVEDVIPTLDHVQSETKARQLPCELTVCRTPSGRVFIKLQANHAAIDGSSLSIILEELAAAYAGTLDTAVPGPLYSGYIRYIRNLPSGEDTKFWMGYLEGLRPCHFPDLAGDNKAERQLRSAMLGFNRFSELRRLSEQTNVTLANIIHVAWALILRKYTNTDDVCFGYLVADRDAPVENIQRTVGTLINMLCCRVIIRDSQAVEEVLRAMQDQHLQSMQYQRCSLAQVQHNLGLGGKTLYNTSISIQSTSGTVEGGQEGVSFEVLEGHDPSEYVITLGVDVAKGDEGIVMRYWSDHVNDDQASTILGQMTQILEAFVEGAAQTVSGHEKKETRTNFKLKHVDTDLALVPEGDDGKTFDGTLVINTSLSDKLGAKPRPDFTVALTEIWRMLLHLPPDIPLSEGDSFFDLGGDSILAMKLVGEARDRGIILTVAHVFQHPMLKAMIANAHSAITPASTDAFGEKETAYSDGTATNESPTDNTYERFSLLAATNIDAFLQTDIVPRVGVFRGGIADVLPATDFQSLAVTGSLLASRWMLNYFYLDGHGPIDVGQFKRACFRLVQSLDILRTVFVPSEGRMLQVVLHNFKPAFDVVEVVDEESMENYIIGLKTPIPKAGEPFVSFTVLKHRHTLHHRILLRISHAQYDGVCLPQILRALQLAYNGEPMLHSTPFAHYLRASAGSLTTEHYSHWKDLLSGSSMTQLVSRTQPNYHRSTQSSTISLRRSVTASPLDFGRITIAAIIKAAWGYTLAQLSSTVDVVFGHTISGRNSAEVSGIDNMIGPCLNLVPVRVRLGQSLTARQLMCQVQDQQVANMPHEVLGFREIIRHCTDWEDWTYFSSTVQHQNIDDIEPLAIGRVTYRVGCEAGAGGDFTDFSVFSQPIPSAKGGRNKDEYEIMVNFAEDGSISREWAQEALNMLCEAVERFVAQPDAPVSLKEEICLRAAQLPFADKGLVATSLESAMGDTLQKISDEKQQNIANRVISAWSQALGKKAVDHNIASDTSFFSLGGDLISLGQVACFVGQGDYADPSLEDLAEHPTLSGHLRIVAGMEMKSKKLGEVTESKVVGGMVVRMEAQEARKTLVAKKKGFGLMGALKSVGKGKLGRRRGVKVGA